MAIGLDQVKRSPSLAKKRDGKTSTKKAQRPWQTQHSSALRPPLAFDATLDFTLPTDTLLLTPEHLDAATTRELLAELAQSWLQDAWRKTRQNSYWLSRLTHQNSWLARVQLFPRIKIPLPSWFAFRDSDF